jgi:hypothetical protein
MTGYESKRAAARDKMIDDDDTQVYGDALTIAYQSGYYDGKKAAQPAQEPVAWLTREDFYRELDRRVERMRKEMEIKTVTMRCKKYDLALNIVDMYGGHIVVGQVSFPPQRPWVGLTDEEKDGKRVLENGLLFNAAEVQAWVLGVEYAEAKLKERNA